MHLSRLFFFAYLPRAIVKYRLKDANLDMSADRAVYELKNLTLVEFSHRDKVRWKLSRTTKKQLLLMNAMSVDKMLQSAT